MLVRGTSALQIVHSFHHLTYTIKQRVANPDMDLIRRAFRFARKAHREQKRLSGEPYIIHPLAVAQILAEQHLDTTTIAAALLHDTVEDTPVGEETIKQEFGEEIGNLVKAVTKISAVRKDSKRVRQQESIPIAGIYTNKEILAAENIRLMLLATANDVRVVLIKLADKLHNMRTLQFQKPEKIQRIAEEALTIYAPIAGRFGMYRVKSDLEDLAFQAAYPEEHKKLLAELKESRSDLENFINTIKKILLQRLGEINISAQIEGRAKHLYSIHRKMVVQGKSLNEIYDLRGVRIVVKDIRDCYGSLGIVHTLWPPLQGRFKDYIATPKINGYQSLHTTVVGPDGRPLEIQIRTYEMEEMADHGIAAHWIYKKETATGPDLGRLKWLGRLRNILDPMEDSQTFIEDLRHELNPQEVYVFTPQGDIIDLPVGATVLDFAFRVHTMVGLSCKGAKVNDRMVPLRTELKSGDRVEILTDKNSNPSPNWLRYIKSPRAKQKLRQYFKKIEEEEGDSSDEHEDSKQNVKDRDRSSKSDKENYKKGDSFPDRIKDIKDFRIRRQETPDPKRVPIEVSGAKDIPVRYAGCCSPVPGDRIVGFITRGRGVTIHRADCPHLPRETEQERIMPVHWEGLTEKYPVRIEISAHDRQGLYLDLVGGITRTYTNILKAEADIPRTTSDLMKARFLVEIEHVDHLRELIEILEAVPGVISVVRVQEK